MIFNALRNRGWQGKGLAHMMAWFGEPNKVHRQNRYNSMDSAVISKQLELMQYAGIQGVIVTWMGASVNPFLNTATQRILAECERRGMLFALLLDPWIAKRSSTQLVDPTTAAIGQLTTVYFNNLLQSPSYLPEKYVLEFDLTHSAGVDVVRLQNAVNFPILSKHVGYSWVEISNTIATLKKDNANPLMKIPLLTLGFNDAGFVRPDGTRHYSQSVWGGPARVLDNQAGNFWMDQVNVTPLSAPYVATVWNDYDEGNTMEQFIAITKGVRLV